MSYRAVVTWYLKPWCLPGEIMTDMYYPIYAEGLYNALMQVGGWVGGWEGTLLKWRGFGRGPSAISGSYVVSAGQRPIYGRHADCVEKLQHNAQISLSWHRAQGQAFFHPADSGIARWQPNLWMGGNSCRVVVRCITSAQRQYLHILQSAWSDSSCILQTSNKPPLLLRDQAAEYKMPIYITETGIADKSDGNRSHMIDEYMRAVRLSVCPSGALGLFACGRAGSVEVVTTHWSRQCGNRSWSS